MAGSSGSAQKNWLIYTALLIAGILLLSDAYGIFHLTKWTARLGIGLIWSAIALLVDKGQWAGNVAVAVVWVAIIATALI